MKNNPLVSILLSAYKPSSYALETTIRSVLNQTLSSFEFIIIKDDDLPETLLLLNKWQQRDSRIKIIDNTVNIGLIASLNRGLESAVGSLIARIDVGDWWESDKLQRQSQLFDTDSELYLCGTALELVDEHYNPIGFKNAPASHEEIASWLLHAKNPFAHPSVMFRKTALRYNPKALYCEDFELWCRYSQLGKMANIDELLTHYVIDTSGVTNQKRSLMIGNMTKAYCAFVEALRQNDTSFIRDGLPIISKTKVSALQVKSNQWYSKAISSSLHHKKIQSIIYFLVAIFFNPALVWNRFKRIYCKIRAGKIP